MKFYLDRVLAVKRLLCHLVFLLVGHVHFSHIAGQCEDAHLICSRHSTHF